jgi:hypothetical protein
MEPVKTRGGGSVSNQVWVTQPRMATCRVVAPKRRLNLWRSAIVVARGKGYRYLIRPWLPSQKGASPVCLHMHHATVSAVATVTFFGAKPVPLWEPSQKGCDLERPQAHHQ